MTADQPALFARGRRRRGRARRGLDASITAWRTGGMLEPADDALLALARITADQLDLAELDPAESRFTVGALAGRHRDVLLTLYDRHRTEDAGPSLAELLAAMDDPTDEPPF
jgi:hypothetical protein